MASQEYCPRCPRVDWDEDSIANFGCLLATVLPMFVFMLFWLFFIFGIFYDITVYFE